MSCRSAAPLRWPDPADDPLNTLGVVEDELDRLNVDDLYRSGIDRTQLQHWGAAHDLVATYVSPATGSSWAAAKRSLGDGDDPRACVDLVLDDEFPLSIFFSSLRTAMAQALVRPLR